MINVIPREVGATRDLHLETAAESVREPIPLMPPAGVPSGRYLVAPTSLDMTTFLIFNLWILLLPPVSILREFGVAKISGGPDLGKHHVGRIDSKIMSEPQILHP